MQPTSPYKKFLVPCLIILGLVIVGILLFMNGGTVDQGAALFKSNVLSSSRVEGTTSPSQDSNKNIIVSSSTATPLPCFVGSTAPSIKLLSPNGGEVFVAGQQITVKWSTCNIPANGSIGIYLGYENFQANASILPLMPTSSGLNSAGSAVLTLPPNSSFSPGNFQYGKNYRVVVKYMQPGPLVDDKSDDTFTILNTKTPLLLTPLDAQIYGSLNPSGVPTGLPEVSANHMFYLKNTSSHPVWINCAHVSMQYDSSGSIGGGGGMLTCASSQGNGSSDFKLNPNQQVLLSRSLTTTFTAPFSSLIRSQITNISYGISPTDVAAFDQNPIDHPAFNQSWIPLLSTPYISL